MLKGFKTGPAWDFLWGRVEVTKGAAELSTGFESDMRRVEVTDCGGCCRLTGICESVKKGEQGLM